MAAGMRLTRAGKLALAKALTGKELHFTCVRIGSGEFDYDTESVFDLEDLRKYEMTLPLTECVVKGDGTVYVQAYLSNAEVAQGFAAREHGLIALEPDTGEEILYAYKNDGDDYDFVPNNTGPAHKNLYVEYICEIQDSENVTATLDLSVAYVGTEDFKAHINALHPHPNTPNHYLDITSTDKIWASDNDNNLHLISVNNLKPLLREETETADAEESLSDEEIIFRAKAELGLDANMLVVEDFTDPNTVDSFRVRVTSSAENGSLLGVEGVEGLRTGAVYLISDGINQEFVKVISVVYNISGYHARLESRLSYSYDWNATYLYRTAYSGAEAAALSWTTGEIFKGVSANIARTIDLNTSLAKADDFDIIGDGFITADGYFTLG